MSLEAVIQWQEESLSGGSLGWLSMERALVLRCGRRGVAVLLSVVACRALTLT